MTKGNMGVGRRTMRNSLNISMRDAPGAFWDLTRCTACGLATSSVLLPYKTFCNFSRCCQVSVWMCFSGDSDWTLVIDSMKCITRCPCHAWTRIVNDAAAPWLSETLMFSELACHVCLRSPLIDDIHSWMHAVSQCNALLRLYETVLNVLFSRYLPWCKYDLAVWPPLFRLRRIYGLWIRNDEKR